MTAFKPTLLPNIPSVGPGVTPDTLYWRKLGFPFTQKEFGEICSIDVSPVEPYYFAACNSTKVQIFNPSTNQTFKQLTKFRSAAYGGTFRRDGKLLVAGDEEGRVRIFDVFSKMGLLRHFKGHAGPVHKCAFLRNDTQVASFSDDKTVALWDIPGETRIHTFNEHQDYIRAGAVSFTNETIIFSGSYDHTIKMYDVRTPSSVWTVDHGWPVEALLALPSSGILISAGGDDVKVWDVVGGRVLSNVTQHNKTVTCLCLASEGRRLLSGSLDCHVNIYDMSTYQKVHTLTYSSPILSIGVTPDDSALIVGMADGLLSIQQRQKPQTDEVEVKLPAGKRKASYRYLLEAQTFCPIENDAVVSHEGKKRLAQYDKYLKEFSCSKALDKVLQSCKHEKKPEPVAAVMRELIVRGTIRSALAGKSEYALTCLLEFFAKYINDARVMRLLIDIINIVLDIYALTDQPPRVQNLIRRLHTRVSLEVAYMKELLILKGTMEMLLAAGFSEDNVGNHVNDYTTENQIKTQQKLN